MDQVALPDAGHVGQRHRRRRRQRRHHLARAAGPRGRGRSTQRSCSRIASTQLGVPVATLTVDKGVVSGGGKTVKYGDLLGGKLFKLTMNPATLQAGVAPAKPVTNYKLVGTTSPRIDLPDKITRQVHVRAQHPRSGDAPRARRSPARPGRASPRRTTSRSASTRRRSSTSRTPQVVQVGNFLAVVAPKEYDAIQAAAQLKVVWKNDPKLAGSGNFWSWLRQAGDTNTTNPARYTTNVGNVDTRARVVGEDGLGDLQVPVQRAHVDRPDVRDRRLPADHMTVFCNSQQPSSVPTTLAAFQLNGQPYFGLPAKEIRCVFYEGASSFGGMLEHGRPDRRLHRRGRASRRTSASRCACSGCAGTSTAGRPTARPRCTTSRPASTRAATSPRSTGPLRAGRHVADADVGARRLRHLAGDPGQRRPEHVGRHLQGRDGATSGCSRRRSRCTAARSRATRCARRARRSRTSPASS